MGQTRRHDRYIDVITCDGADCEAIVTEGRDHTVTELAGKCGWVNSGEYWFCSDCARAWADTKKSEAAR